MALLETHDLTAFYGDFQALFGITCARGGRDGRHHRRQRRRQIDLPEARSAACSPAAADRMRFDGARYRRAAGRPRSCARGIAHGARRAGGCFPRSRVEENLLVGAYGRRSAGPLDAGSRLRLFPMLKERAPRPRPRFPAASSRWWRSAARLMSNPRVLLCDEISLGLAPIVIRDIYAALAEHQAAAAPAWCWSSRTSPTPWRSPTASIASGGPRDARRPPARLAATPSTPPISALKSAMAWLDRHGPAGHPARRALCAVRRRACR